ncbi:hypothetical protein DXA13_11265 [Clostridium sp. AM58-1XD]|nr:hypothetical protein DXA13_11265 [Clostridium sp. AM58-1XD]
MLEGGLEIILGLFITFQEGDADKGRRDVRCQQLSQLAANIICPEYRIMIEYNYIHKRNSADGTVYSRSMI